MLTSAAVHPSIAAQMYEASAAQHEAALTARHRHWPTERMRRGSRVREIRAAVDEKYKDVGLATDTPLPPF